MRLVLVALLALLPDLANANQISEAVSCGEAPQITSTDVSEGVGSAALADADAYADKLSELPTKARETVKSLNETYTIGNDVVTRNYFVAVCQRLKEKGVAAETLKPGIIGLAQALDVPSPVTAEAAPGQPAGSQVATAPEPSPATDPAAPKPTPPSDVTPPTAEPGATPAPAPSSESAQAPAAETKVDPAPAGVPADPAATDKAASAPAAPATTPEQPQTPPNQNVTQGATPPGTPGAEQPGAPETSTMAKGDAPEGQPQGALTPGSQPEPLQASPGSTEQPKMAETPGSATSAPPVDPTPAPPPASAATESAPAPAATAPAQTAQNDAAPAAGATPPAAPGGDQPAAPETSTMSKGDAPAGQPQGAITPGSQPEPTQASPGSTEQPASGQTPAASASAPAAQPDAPAPAPQAAAPAPEPQAPATTQPQERAAGTDQPAAPQTSTMAKGDAPAGQPQGAITPGSQPEPAQSSPGSTEQPGAGTTSQTAQAPATPPAATPAAPETPVPSAAPPLPPVAVPAPAAASAPKPAGLAQLNDDECRALGVLTACPDLNSVLAQLMEKPLEFNKPSEMYQYRKTEIGLVLRTDWQGKDLPPQVSEQMKNLPGEVQQGLTKITRVMSAELTGGDFDVAPTGRQERTVVIPQPVTWNWQVTPHASGPAKPLKLQLFAHIEGPSGTMPPILIKTLDATIDVDVRTWDWILAQIRGLEPMYAVIAALLGLLTAVLTYFFTRPSERSAGSYRASGPVIGDLDQSGGSPRRDERDPNA
jgi:hypothetical protein